MKTNSMQIMNMLETNKKENPKKAMGKAVGRAAERVMKGQWRRPVVSAVWRVMGRTVEEESQIESSARK